MSPSCVFCRIVEGSSPASIVDQDLHPVCLVDVNPWTEGHCLVVSRRHVPWWHDLNEDETAALFLMARRVARRLREVYGSEFVCMYARGRRIPHTHVFLVPTEKGDVLDGFFNALEKFQEAPPAMTALRDRESLERTAKKIRG